MREDDSVVDIVPNWSSVGSWSLGRDPLGMQATSVRLYRSLVPGLTNVTNRLRYFSFYCWVIDEYEQRVHSHDIRKWARFIRRAEAVYVLASVLTDDSNADGMAGLRWARGLKNNINEKNFDLRPAADNPNSPDAYIGAARGNFGQFYVATMLDEGMLHHSSGIPVVSAGYGKELAASFRSSIGDVADILAEAIEQGTITIKNLEFSGDAAHPCRIPDQSSEMELLRRYLLCEDAGEEPRSMRRTTAWLLLDLMRRGVSGDDGIAIRQAFYNRHLPRGKSYRCVGSTVDHWRAFQANEFAHIALEVILNGLISLQVANFPNGAAPDVLIRLLFAKVEPSLELSNHTWTEWVRGSEELVGKEETLADVLLVALRNPDQSANDTKAWTAALQMLGILYARWNSSASNVFSIIEQAALGGGKSLAGLLRSLVTLQSNPASHALLIVLRRHVFADHLAIAGRKLSSSGTFTYHFTLADGLINDGRLSPYGYTTPRIANLVRFLRDAQLCEGDHPTPDGIRFLNDHQPV